MRNINAPAIIAIYRREMQRFLKTFVQSIAAPVISTSLYFIVFGTAIGSRIDQIDNIDYGAFLVPGMLILTLIGQSISNASFGIFLQKFTGLIYELLSAPISSFEMIVGFIGAAIAKSLLIATIILATASLFVDFHIQYPFTMALFLFLTCFSFSLFGFIIGLWADDFDKLSMIPTLIITPLVFLGGGFYSIHMLPPFWQNVSLLNPLVYLVSGLRWSFYGSSDVSISTSLLMIVAFLLICSGVIIWMFKTGYRLRS